VSAFNGGEGYRQDIKDQLGFAIDVNRPPQPSIRGLKAGKAEWRPLTPTHREGGHQCCFE
jgi:hypothetical protein